MENCVINKERKISQYICSIANCDSIVKYLPMERHVKYHRYKMENDKKGVLLVRCY